LACAALLVTLLFGRPAEAGPNLDRILNNMILDVHNGSINRDDYKTITPEVPIGQTFTTGPNIVEVSRIAVAQAYWHETWTQDESLVLTLWDSPAKKNLIAQAEMPYKWREWEGQVIMYTLNAKVQPNTQYYFELTVKGGDGKIVGVFLGSNYEGGGAFEGGRPAEKNIWFEVHGRSVFDRDAAYADRFAMWNLDYPGLEKVKAAVSRKDWDAAVDELIRYYESKPELVDPSLRPKKNPQYDASYDELVLDKKIKDDEGNIIDLGPNWNHFRTWPTRGGVGLTRSGIMKNLAGAYRNTADEKFAKGFNELMFNLLNDIPSPLRAGVIKPDAKNVNPAPPSGIAGGSMWAGLSIAARMNQMWYFYSSVAASPNFTRDIRAAMIFNMVDMARVLSMQKGGGNWDSQMSTALYELAERHPELAQSKEWFNQGLNSMLANLWSISRSDGTIQEPTFGYTTLVINRFRKLLDTCKRLNISIDPKYVKRVEKSIEYLMYSTEPNGDLPSRGDTFNFVDSKEQLIWAADYYNRDDFLYIATGGKQGRIPTGASMLFPIGGWLTMRSDWGPDALYLNLHNGKNMGHGHADELSICIDAYGSKLVIDPGCYTYGTPEQTEISKSRNHATVTVDDKDTITEYGENSWVTTGTIDYYNGTNAGYEDLENVKHTRRILFLKPDYWVIRDSVTGEGEHKITSRFPFLPGEIDLDAKTGICRTKNAGGNLMIVPDSGSDFVAQVYTYNFPRDGLKPAPGVSYSKKTTLPANLSYALIPYKGTKAPKASFNRIADNAFRVSRADGTDFVVFDNVSSADVEFKGEALVARESGSAVKSIGWVNGTEVKLHGCMIASSSKPIKSLELIRDGDTLLIRSSCSEPTLKVAALGARRYRVGFGPIKAVSSAVIEPFRE